MSLATFRPIPELLAPAGSICALRAVIEAGADSVYLAGKMFGMRQHAAWLNFSNDEIREAVRWAHERGVRIYVTVNNLLTDHELTLVEKFLDFLVDAHVDAVIIQDLGLLDLCRKMHLPLPLHASTMMNVHEEQTAAFLGKQGITRIVASRDITLARAVEIQERTGIEFEVFLHGDMCIAHGGQCLTSGILTGESSNRGKCLKPCRWQYDLVDFRFPEIPLPNPNEGNYLLARKDLSLLERLPEVAGSGIAALKIEGRARKPEFLRFIVSQYRKALDRYAASSTSEVISASERAEWHERRVRNLSTCYTFGNPQAETIDYSGKREPRFFSIVIEQKPLEPDVLERLMDPVVFSRKPELVVHCPDFETAVAAGASGAECVRLPGFTRKSIEKYLDDLREFVAREEMQGIETGFYLDRVLTPSEWKGLSRLLEEAEKIGVTHVVGSTPAIASLAREAGLDSIADYGLNVFNERTVGFLLEQGFSRATAALECTLEQVQNLADSHPGKIEALVHGALPGMISEHCVIHASLAQGRTAGTCRDLCSRKRYALRDLLGQTYPIRVDRHCRNHIFLPKDLCALPVLDRLLRHPIQAIRIEGIHQTAFQIEAVVRGYRRVLDEMTDPQRCVHEIEEILRNLRKVSDRDFSLCAYGNEQREIALPESELPTNLVITYPTRRTECVSADAPEPQYND